MDLKHTTNRGQRLKGWEGINTGMLAKVLGVSGRHLRLVLRGREKLTPGMADRIEKCTGWTAEEIGSRIRLAGQK